MHRSNAPRVRWSVLHALALAALLVCDDSLDDGDHCTHRVEFGATGCAEHRGIVTRPDGVPNGGATVRAFPPERVEPATVVLAPRAR